MKKIAPLTEATFYILLALLHKLHGYGIMKKVEELSEGRVKIAAGTLYGALNNLLFNKYITLESSDELGKKKKEYLITEKGLVSLKSEIIRLSELHQNGLKEMELYHES